MSTSFPNADDTSRVAPYSVGSKRPAFMVPVGACDCHMQLFDSIHPIAAQCLREHDEATADDYRKLQHRLGLQRNVLVQPSSYGGDHQVLLAGLKALGSTARGVAMVHPSISHAHLHELHKSGIVGTRFDLVTGNVLNESMLEDVARLIQPLGWHIQIHAHPHQLLRLAHRLIALPVTVVIDHYALLNMAPDHSSELAAMLSRMLDTGKIWLKLSAPYIASPNSLAYEDLEIFVRHLAYKHLDRLVWGTNWPHPTRPCHGKPDDAVLANLLERWLFQEEIHRILVDNPARLYRFSSSC